MWMLSTCECSILKWRYILKYILPITILVSLFCLLLGWRYLMRHNQDYIPLSACSFHTSQLVIFIHLSLFFSYISACSFHTSQLVLFTHLSLFFSHISSTLSARAVFLWRLRRGEKPTRYTYSLSQRHRRDYVMSPGYDSTGVAWWHHSLSVTETNTQRALELALVDRIFPLKTTYSGAHAHHKSVLQFCGKPEYNLWCHNGNRRGTPEVHVPLSSFCQGLTMSSG